MQLLAFVLPPLRLIDGVKLHQGSHQSAMTPDLLKCYPHSKEKHHNASQLVMVASYVSPLLRTIIVDLIFYSAES